MIERVVLVSPRGFCAGVSYAIEIVDRIGAGDSFVAGLIHGLIDGDLDLAIRLASYAAAIGLATPGDINYFAPEDLAAFHADTTGTLLR